MSAKQKKAPAENGGARNGRRMQAWFATQPPPGCDGGELVRRAARGPARTWAWCDSHARAVRLAAALNREERARAGRLHEIAVRDTALAKLGDVRHALRVVLEAVDHAPVVVRPLAMACAQARRVLGDEPTFAPGGEEVAR